MFSQRRKLRNLKRCEREQTLSWKSIVDKKVAALANCPQALDFVDVSVRFDPELVKIALGQEYRPASPKERLDLTAVFCYWCL
eukprot:Skav227515  [mRNA]  locus=scaffold2269:46999:49827:- [translate_table: standard]